MKIRKKFISLLLTLLLLGSVLLPGSVALAAPEQAAADASTATDGTAEGAPDTGNTVDTDAPAAEEPESDPLDMWIAAGAALLYDEENGTYLYEQNADGRMYPAALVKTMTLLLVTEAIEANELLLTDRITVTAEALEPFSSGGNTLGIAEGDELTVEELLYCATVGSANEACTLLAIAAAGSEEAFVTRMNERATALGCTATHFSNSHGLHSPDQYTTARDMLYITQEGMRHELFRSFVSATRYVVQSENYSGRRTLNTANYLLSGKIVPGYTYSYATGVRTGYTPEAGNCLIASATRNGRTMIAVIMNARNGTSSESTYMLSFREAARLLQWGYANFSVRTLVESTELIQELHVELAKDNDYVVLRPATDLTAMVPSGIDAEDFTRTVILLDEEVRAPIEEGQLMGQLTVSANGVVYGAVELLALTAVEPVGFLGSLQRVTLFFHSPLVRFLSLIVLVAALIVCSSALRREKNSRKRQTRRRDNISYLDDARRTTQNRKR